MFKNMSDKTKKILNYVFTTFEIIVVIFLLTFSIFTISSSSTTKETRSFFGSTTFTVLTDSMDPTIKSGDLIFTKKLNDKEKQELVIGDIICFWTNIDINGDGVTETVVNTHKIVEVIPMGDDVYGYDQIAYRTQGDNNPTPDDKPVLASHVIAKYKFRIPAIGGWINSAKEGNRYFFIIVLPLILLFLWNGYHTVKILVENQKEKALAQAKGISEEEKAALLEEAKRLALEELRKEQEEKTKE